jgi:ketosteroid isomerase-like protein
MAGDTLMASSETRGGLTLANVELARQLYDAFNRADMPAVLALFDPAIEFREAEGNPYRPDGTPWIGPQTILTELFMRIGQEWDGFSVRPGVIRAMDGGAVMEGRYTAVFKETGRALDMPICHVLLMRDGRITHFQQYADTASLQWVMGVTLPR